MTPMSKDDDANVVCANLDCRVAETGKCVEGFEVAACPHFGQTPSKVTKDETTPAISKASEESVRLPSATTLTIADAARLLRAGDARIIAIIGPRDAGKTSLIASLYDLFQEGPVSGVEFARSRTLHTFEQTCHDARAASRRNVPHTNRTPLGEVRFYHLDLGGGPAGESLALAVGDRAGEEYLNATDDTTLVSGFPEVWRADSLTLLVDGSRLVDNGGRHNLRSESTMIVQSLVDGDAVQPGQRLAVVLTKIDLVQASPRYARAESDFANLLSSLEQLFGHIFSTIEPFKIAASPKTDAVPRSTGVPGLLTFWLERAVVTPTAPPSKPSFERAFARLQPLDDVEGGA